MAFTKKRWLKDIRKRAKKKNLYFNLDESDLETPNICPVLGIPLFRNVGGVNGSANSPSIDRIDNTKGYIKGNVQIISNRANSLKSDASIEELEAILKHLKQIRQSSPTQERKKRG